MRRTMAFTLIELLVVITIIVVLLALLVPSLDKAIAATQSAVCMTRLRNWGMAVNQYGTDHRNAVPPLYMEQAQGKLWPNYLARYVGEPSYNDNATTRPNGALRANTCPITPVREPQGQAVGSASTMWEILTATGSYGMNLWLVRFAVGLSGDPTGLTGYAPEKYWGTYRNVPGETPILGDSGWVGGWADHTNTPIAREQTEAGGGYSSPPYEFELQMNRWALKRHNLPRQAVNFGFVDLSVRNVPLGELWTLRWHRSSVPTRDYENAFD